jgi:hypothetical protein
VAASLRHGQERGPGASGEGVAPCDPPPRPRPSSPTARHR